jgi:P27 family predicted phage terminase small subunit
MGARGPIPAPDNVRNLRGRTSHMPAPKRVTFPPGAPEMPSWLDREAKAEWRRVVPDLASKGILSRCDRAALSAYCDAWSRFVQARRELGVESLTVAGRQAGEVRNPKFLVYRDAATLVEQLSRQVFLTPVSRLRAVAPGGADADDEGDGILA